MQIPWRTLHAPTRRLASVWLPTGVLCLLGLDVICFLAQSWLEPGISSVESWSALSWTGLRAGWFWQPLTCLFLHPSLPDLALGMWMLWIGGRRLEAIVGRRHLLALYLIGGMAGALGQISVNWLGHLHDNRFISSYLGSMPAALALFAAYACIMPETVMAAPWPIPLRIKTRHLAVVLAAASAGLMAWDFRFGPTGQPAAAWLIGSAVGCLYSWQMGFGQRMRANEELPRPNNAAVSMIHVPAMEVDSGNPRQPRKTPILVAKVSPVNAGASLNEARFSESERRMSAREYIAERIDPILDKISLHGIGSLTDEERAALEKGREKISQAR